MELCVDVDHLETRLNCLIALVNLLATVQYRGKFIIRGHFGGSGYFYGAGTHFQGRLFHGTLYLNRFSCLSLAQDLHNTIRTLLNSVFTVMGLLELVNVR